MTVQPLATYRRAHPADLDALVALEEATFTGDRLSRRQYRRHLDSASARVIVAVRGKRLVAAAVVFFREGTRVARLYSLATADVARGLGMGSALLRRAEVSARRHACHSMRLEVRPDNRAAIGLYERAGYVPIGRRPAYYEDGSDALRYEKSLRSATGASSLLPPGEGGAQRRMRVRART